MANTPSKTNGSAIGIIEEAVHFLRLAPIELLFIYYLGTLPFVLGLMYFWGDMSRSAFADTYCSVAALGLAMLFVWMKTWQSVFTQMIHRRVSHSAPDPFSVSGIVRLVLSQTVLHVSGIFVLPVALLFTLPFPWVYALYQNLLVCDVNRNNGLWKTVKETFSVARVNTRQNVFIVSIISTFKLFVMLNVGITLYVVPQLLKSLAGIQTAFTMGGFSIFNSTFVVSVLCLTHLCVDPLVKTIYTLRYFYGESETTGKDLLSELLRATKRSSAVFFVTAVTLISVIYPGETFSEDQHSLQIKKELVQTQPVITSDDLERSIGEVLKRKEFAWRLPREKRADEQDTGILGDFFKWLKPYLKKTFDTIKGWLKAFDEWLENLIPEFDKGDGKERNNKKGVPKTLVYVLLGLSAAVLLGFLARFFLIKRRIDKEPPAAVDHTPDLSDETVLADDLPPDEWLLLAKELVDKGELRLAIRALYLSTLSRLAENKLISIAGHKSNREYQAELFRRAHEKTEMIESFRETVMSFDRFWYGMYGVDLEDVQWFEETQKRIVGFAQ